MSSLNETSKGMRTVIAVLGRRNAGKSSLINALVGFDLAIVSGVPGTTTDPVEKAVELNPLGPCLLIDTAGIDDDSELGAMRIQKTNQVLENADIGLLVVGDGKITDYEEDLVAALTLQKKPFIVVINKIDLERYRGVEQTVQEKGWPYVLVSTVDGRGIAALKDLIRNQKDAGRLEDPGLLDGIVKPGDMVVLVVPIDSGAPKGRLILPQVQTLRNVLDYQASALVVTEKELAKQMDKLSSPPDLVITDSQAVLEVHQQLPDYIPLTTFSIIFSRYKGDLPSLAAGARAIDSLDNGDMVLIAEACTHHPFHEDIGRVKIPRWMRQFTGKDIDFQVTAGPAFPKDLKDYKLIVQCGGCTITRRSYLNRMEQAEQAGVPITNYGIAISYMQGVLDRTLSLFPELQNEKRWHKAQG